MTRTSLTDRYVWTVTRQLSPQTGPDVARELRGTIEETVEAVEGYGYFGYRPAEGESDADMARRHTATFLQALQGGERP